MEKQIWKFLINPAEKLTAELPKGAEILTVQVQNETPFIWALVDPSADEETRYFELYGTGHDIHYDMGINRKYINTFQIKGGLFVYHLFERID